MKILDPAQPYTDSNVIGLDLVKSWIKELRAQNE